MYVWIQVSASSLKECRYHQLIQYPYLATLEAVGLPGYAVYRSSRQQRVYNVLIVKACMVQLYPLQGNICHMKGIVELHFPCPSHLLPLATRAKLIRHEIRTQCPEYFMKHSYVNNVQKPVHTMVFRDERGLKDLQEILTPITSCTRA